MSYAIWLLGVPGSGKTTIGEALVQSLGGTVELLDGDDVRKRITPSPSWAEAERAIVYRSIAEIARRLVNRGVPVIISASGGGVNIEDIRTGLPHPNVLVHVRCDLETAFARRPDGVYQQSITNSIRLPLVRVDPNGGCWPEDVEFCRKHSIQWYELRLPLRLDLTIDTAHSSIQECARLVLAKIQDLET